MTNSESPFPPAHVRIDGRGDLIAAVPAMLGFYPRRSIILLFLGGESGWRIGPIVRHDMLPHDLPDDLVHRTIAALCERIAVVHESDSIRTVIAVLVDDWPSVTHDVIAASFVHEFAARGINVGDVLWVPEIRPGRLWRSVLTRVKDRLPDPATSPLTTAAVVGGNQIFDSREGIEATLQLASEAERKRVAASLRRKRSPVRPKDAFETILASAAVVDAGDALDPTAAAVISIAFEEQDRLVRDAALALAATSFSNAAEQLWTALARVLPTRRRADPLTLLGHSAYLRGNGALACVAFAAALKADPDHTLARMLDHALQRAMSPDEIRQLSSKGFDCAARIGVDLKAAG